jgi:hypothetical protein
MQICSGRGLRWQSQRAVMFTVQTLYLALTGQKIPRQAGLLGELRTDKCFGIEA